MENIFVVHLPTTWFIVLLIEFKKWTMCGKEQENLSCDVP